jgi:hypothetical protein
MNRLATLGGLSLRELWIGYRLLLAMLAFALSGLVAAIAPAPGWRPHALALAGAIAVTAGLVASAVAGDRLRGFVGWLVARSVPRATVAIGWLLAASISVLAGVSLAIVTASTFSGGGPAAEAAVLPGVVVAVAATGVAAAGVAIALGLLLPLRLALPITTAVVAAWLAPIVLVAPPGAPLPGGGLALLADLGTDLSGSGAALRVAGVTFASAAVAWGAAIVVASRIDL